MHQAQIITDLTFGDAGKGTITDALVRRGATLVVRYNGGAQAAHTVIDNRNRCHIFHQFGSGTLVEGTQTFLSRHMLVNPLALHYEEMALAELGIPAASQHMHIDPRALVTTPLHMVMNQLRELARGPHRHGSCGLGIGETAADALDYENQAVRYADLRNAPRLKTKLCWQRDLKRKQLHPLLPALKEQTKEDAAIIDVLLNQLESDNEMEATLEVFAAIADRFQTAPLDFLEDHFSKPGTTIFEGAQGVLLDENWGFHPYTTWSTTTPKNALELIQETHQEVKTTVLGLTRAYQTRHGTGPFPTESQQLTDPLAEPHNPTNLWQGPFRAGHLDLELLRYAVQVSQRIDGLVVTHLDRLQALNTPQVATGYHFQTAPYQLDTNPKSGLAGRAKAGKILNEVTLTYETAPSNPDEYASLIAEKLNLPLLGKSYGPTPANKWFR
jgi:adenylosuccinate synthase